MEIYKPLLFVGLGGTGGKVGAELERRLRRALCGADGANIIGSDTRSYLPYQLPSCFQFVYADLDERESHELRLQSVPAGDHSRAVERTAHDATGLVPVQRGYPEVAQNLRIRAEREVRDWLPPADGEPTIAPLAAGAGQLPTVARVALFETLATSGIDVAQRPITEAVHALSHCAEELAALGGASADYCDVFVAFSLAGGTGTGIFYDYLHLIADAFKDSGIDIQIHPLVVMPSAFAEGQGGGRPARLNVGRALLDLFRLVDDQNMRAADSVYRSAQDQHRGMSVTFPGTGRTIRIEPSTVQTAYLFSQTGALQQADLHRSIVSFLLSMAGIRNAKAGEANGAGGTQSAFLNRATERQSLAPSGIGGRGASTAAVASLSVPRGEILDILAAHLLSRVVDSATRGRAIENNDPLIKAFLTATGLLPLWERPHDRHSRQTEQMPPGPDRAERMQREARHLEDTLRLETVPQMASDFNPVAGLQAVLDMPTEAGKGPVDLFRAERALFGSDRLARPAEQAPLTIQSLLINRTRQLQVDDAPPADGPGQDQWRERKQRALWHQAWAEQRPVWEPKLGELRAELRDLTGALREHQVQEAGSFGPRVTDLFAERVAAPYFLPYLPTNFDAFYHSVIDQLVKSLEITNSNDTSVLTELLGTDLWRRLADESRDLGAGRALAYCRRLIDKRMRDQTNGGTVFLPRLAALLASASGVPNEVAEHDRERFREKLKGMIPAGLLLQAAGRAKILVTYPVSTALPVSDVAAPLTRDPAAAAAGGNAPLAQNSEVEEYLEHTIRVGHQQGAVDFEFRPTAEESLTVVLIRTSLGVTDVPEVREVMSFWSDTLRSERRGDFLKWRQRLGYHYDWLLTTEEHRRDILHRLLIAMWNGQVDVLAGTPEKPREIAIRISPDHDDSVTRLQLRLKPFGPTSPWGSLLHAYEESTLGGDEQNRQEMYRRLMDVTPVIPGASDYAPGGNGGRLPADQEVYMAFREVADREVDALKSLRADLQSKPRAGSTRLRHIDSLLEFWQKTVPHARSKEFDGSSQDRYYSNLDELEEAWEGHS